MFGGQKCTNQDVGWAMIPLEALGKNPFFASNSFWWPPAFLGLWLCPSNASLHRLLLFHLSNLLPSSGDVVALRTHLDKPEAEAPALRPLDAKNWFIEKDPDAGKDVAEGEGDNRGWDGWMASLIRWTWVWARSNNWWWTRKPGVLQSMGLLRVRPNWATEQNWTEINQNNLKILSFLKMESYNVWPFLAVVIFE